MGQTLPNGIYLPAEGERNCYDGLEGNWRSLDGLISTVAGKASASHTHGNITNDGKVGTAANKPLITGTGGVVQAGSFGTLANTFCEGNDSRLSDARTPVAHTHTKSDVTDLLNSNFIPSANNSYDLGSSSYQWNNLYAKNYYYNGTAWGLDKANVWSGENTFLSSFSKRNNAMTLGTTPAEVLYNSLFFKDKNNTLLASLDQQFNTDGSAHFVLRIAPNQSGATRVGAWEYIHDGTNRTMTFNATLCPVAGDHALGTSTYKWKTLNGINPGGLCLHNFNAGITLDTTNWDKTGNYGADANFWTPTVNGWLTVLVTGTPGTGWVRLSQADRLGQCSICLSNGYAWATIPVVANWHCKICLLCSTVSAKFYPCQGNV